MRTMRIARKRAVAVFLIISVLIFTYTMTFGNTLIVERKDSEKYIHYNNAEKMLEPGDIKYSINNKNICKQHHLVSCIVLVHSEVTHFNRRLELRNTWLNSTFYKRKVVKVVYLVGTVNDETLTKKLVKENRQHADVIQGNFIDTFRNSTYKGFMGIKWVNEYCLNAEVVIKTDDNAFINLFLFFEQYFSQIVDDAYIMGAYMQSSKIIRAKSSRWYVPDSYLKGKQMYPSPYLSGYAVFLPTTLIPSFYRAAISSDFFPVEDYYLFGVLPAKIQSYKNGVKFQFLDNKKYMIGNEEQWINCYASSGQKCKFLTLFTSSHRLDMERLWYSVIKDRNLMN